MSTDVLAIRGDGTATSETIPDIPGPQLPAWTFDAGTGGNPGAGAFQINNADPTASIFVYFNRIAKNGVDYVSLFTSISTLTLLILTDSVGVSFISKTTVVFSLIGDVYTASIGFVGGTSAPLSGDYTLSFAPSNQLTPDASWATPSSVGNKATVLTNYDTAGLAAAAALVGLGDTNTQVGELTDVLQALITYLRAQGVLTS